MGGRSGFHDVVDARRVVALGREDLDGRLEKAGLGALSTGA